MLHYLTRVKSFIYRMEIPVYRTEKYRKVTTARTAGYYHNTSCNPRIGCKGGQEVIK